ncbi:MAG TPA: phosphoribosylformylglycinamidine synthase I [Terriglobia bacterium]
MSRSTTAILYAPGTNCHEETAAALERAGGRSELVLLRDLLDHRTRLDHYQATIIPGGFSYGDHLGAGRVFACVLVAQLRDQLGDFLDSGKPILGVCNGFQVLTEAGILPGRTPGRRAFALVDNQSWRFEDRMVRLAVSEEGSLWTKGLGGRVLEMPTANGEGRPLAAATAQSGSHVAFRYCDANGHPTMDYPNNPNGAPDAAAGITDRSGKVLGLMPHPERASLPGHPSQDGLALFRNLIQWLRHG